MKLLFRLYFIAHSSKEFFRFLLLWIRANCNFGLSVYFTFHRVFMQLYFHVISIFEFTKRMIKRKTKSNWFYDQHKVNVCILASKFKIFDKVGTVTCIFICICFVHVCFAFSCSVVHTSVRNSKLKCMEFEIKPHVLGILQAMFEISVAEWAIYTSGMVLIIRQTSTKELLTLVFFTAI